MDQFETAFLGGYRLREQRESCEAAERILKQAEQEARALTEEAREHACRMERQAEEVIFAKRQAAARALVVRYLDTFNTNH